MAYISEGEDELLRQQGMSGGGGSAPATRAPTKSGSWTNLNKYMVSSDSAGDALIKSIEPQRQNLENENTQINKNADYLENIYNNPSLSDAEKETNASNIRNISDFNKDIEKYKNTASQIGNISGRFDLLKNIQQPGATSGISKLNEYLISRGAGGNKLSDYYNSVDSFSDKLKKDYISGSDRLSNAINKIKEQRTPVQPVPDYNTNTGDIEKKYTDEELARLKALGILGA